MNDLDLCFADLEGNKIFDSFVQSAKNAALDELVASKNED
jgi:hypothetical protein